MELAAAIDSVVVPVGPPWSRWNFENPEADLYYEDGCHPNPIGSYPTACVFYSVLFNKSTEGLTGRIKFESSGDINLIKSLSEKLQKAAWNAVSKR